MDLVPTPSQTIGPFFHFCLNESETFEQMAGSGAKGERVKLVCRVTDGDGAAVDDAMIELWQADADGKYDHPADTRLVAADPAFRGFGRLATNDDGTCVFETVKPGRVPGESGALQAPHIDVSVFARGLLQRLFTRIYFEGDPSNDEDAVLSLVAADRRGTLVARANPKHPGVWNFDIRLCCESETVFFDI
jgi:protocatechuate 3,4-dioxygenase, alpha subunit